MDGEISPAKLETLLSGEEVPTIVDIRNPAGYRREHIPGSLNIPFGALPREVERVEGEDHVVTVCPHGKASVQAARLITSFEGFDGRVESLESGITGWEGPLTSEQTNEAPDAVGDDGDESPTAPF